MLERDARGGTRYIEILKAQFGVTSPDSRLQRPEYLGGGHSRLDVSQVAKIAYNDIQHDALDSQKLFHHQHHDYNKFLYSKQPVRLNAQTQASRNQNEFYATTYD
jgi:hypothetical protein